MLEEHHLKTPDASIECGQPQLQVRIRELRLVSERLLLLTGLDRGMVPGVREFLVASQIATGGVIPYLYHTMMRARVPALPSLTITGEQPGRLAVDCANQNAIFVGPLLLDLMKLRVAQTGSVSIQIENIADPTLLGGLVLLANQSGVASNLVYAAGGSGLESMLGTGIPTESIFHGRMHNRAPSETTAAEVDGREERAEGQHYSCHIFATRASSNRGCSAESETSLGPDVLQAMNEGFQVAGSIWWPLYRRSNEALNKTSEISRRHAGRTPEEMANDADPY